MNFSLTLLGTGAALPVEGRFPSAHLVSFQGLRFLLDCGEGAQYQLRRFGTSTGSVSHIFITHLHGDHCYGLPGLLSSYQLLGRRAALHIFSPPGLEDMVRTVLGRSHVRLGFPLHFQVVPVGEARQVWANDKLSVSTLPLLHRVPTCGYLIREKPHLRTLRPGVLEEFGIPFAAIEGIKKGAPFRTAEGGYIDNERLTLPAPPSRALAYCTDTAYNEALIPLLRGVDLLYHEATFCEDARERAKETGHATARQAAELARAAKVGQLVMGHFSSRYPAGEVFEREARRVFPGAVAGVDGQRIGLPYSGRKTGPPRD